MSTILPALLYSLPLTLPLALGSNFLFQILTSRLSERKNPVQVEHSLPRERSAVAFASVVFGLASLLPIVGLMFVPGAALFAYLVLRNPERGMLDLNLASRGNHLSRIGLIVSLSSVLCLCVAYVLGKALAP